MDAIAKYELPIRVTAAEAERVQAETPEVVTRGVKELEEYVIERGYEDFHHTLTKNPRSTNRGILYAEGTFAGPSPHSGGEDRAPDDFAEYSFIVVEDKDYEDLFLIEVNYRSARLAVFEVKSDRLELLSGEIEHINADLEDDQPE